MRPPDADRRTALLLGAAALAVYLLTLCPTVYIGDSGELAAVAATFGIAHPPGYPLWTLLYGAVVHTLPWCEPVAVCNGFGAVIAAATVAVVFALLRTLGVGRAPAAAAALGLAVARQFWYQAVSVEVYALDGLLLAATLWATVSLARAPAAAWTRRRWLGLGLLAGLTAGHRPVDVLYLGLWALWLEAARRRSGAAPGGWLALVAAAAASGTVFLYLPIAAAADPPLNMGDPSTWEGFWAVVSAAPYQRHVQSGTAELTLARLSGSAWALPLQLGLSSAAVAWGLLRPPQDVRALAWIAALSVLVNLAFASTYNILDNDGFFQPALLSCALLAALGWQRLLEGRARLAVAVLAAALLPATWTWRAMDLSAVDATERYAQDLLRSAEPGGLLLVQGDTPRAALSYLQAVRRARPDVAVLTPAMLLDWHIEEVQRRAPHFGLPPPHPQIAPAQWLRAVVRSQLQRNRPVYLTAAGDARVQDLLDPDLLPRADLVPAGLLTRLVLAPVDRAALAARAQQFWADSPGIEAGMDTARQDPQLQILPVHYARARFVLAAELLQLGQREEARAHFAAIAASGVDARERAVADAFRGIGRDLTPRRFGERAAEALR